MNAAINGLDMSSQPSCGLAEESRISNVRDLFKKVGQTISHIIDPFGCPIVGMRRLERANIVGFSIIVPGDNLNEARTKFENFAPPVIPE